jgi:signal transduction histidine kinase
MKFPGRFSRVLLSIILLWNLLGYGQVLQSYGPPDGLSTPKVYCLETDSTNLLWLSTDRGIYSFNGFDFANYRLDNEDVISIDFDDQGRLWAINSSAQLAYLKEGRIHNHETDPWIPKKLESLITASCNFKGKYYICHEENILCIDDTTATHLIRKSTFRSVTYCPWVYQGNLFFLSADSMFQLVSDRLVSKPLPFPFPARAREVLEIDNVTYFVFPNSLVRYTEGEAEIIYQCNNNELFDGRLFKDGDRILLAVRKQLFRIDGNELHVELTMPSAITCYLKDRYDNQWISTLHHGLYKIPSSYPDVNQVVKDDPTRSFSHFLGIQDEAPVLACYDGYFYYRDKYIFPDITHPAQVRVAQPYQYGWLLGTDYGLYFQRGDTAELLLRQLAVKQLIVKEDRFFVSFNAGMQEYEILEDYSIRLVKDHHKRRTYTFSLLDGGGIYLSALDGFYKINPDGKKTKILKDQPFIQTKCKIVRRLNHRLTILVTGNNHLYLLDNQAGTLVRTKHNPAIFSTHGIQNVHADPTDTTSFWLLSRNNIVRCQVTDSSISISKSIRFVGKETSSELNDMVPYSDSILFLNNRGVYSFHPKDYKPLVRAPLRLYQVSAGDLIIHPNSNGVYEIPVGQTNAKIAVFDPRYVSKKIRYRLKGDSDWNTMSSNTLEVPFMQEGRRTIEFSSFSQNEPMEVVVHFSRVWYESNFFRIAFIVVFLTSILFIIYRQRVFASERLSLHERILHKETALNLAGLQSQMNPHFMRNCLNSIQSLIYTDQKKQALNFIHRFSSLIEQFIKQSRQNFIPVQEEVKMLENFISMEQLRFGDSIRVKIDVEDEKISHVKIPSMLLQPLVENAIEHGLINKFVGDKQLIIRFTKNQDALTIQVIDNGIGYNENKVKGSSIALNNIRERVKTINKMNYIDVRFDIFNNKSKPGVFNTGTTAQYVIRFQPD